jgi:hypothetical protein
LDITGTGDFELSAPIVYPGSPGVADRMTNIVATDSSGPVVLTSRDDPAVGGGLPYFRHWRAMRAVKYPVRVTYRALVQSSGGDGGPAFGVRAIGRGVGGSPSTLIMMPEDKSIVRTAVRWDLSTLPANSFAMSSWGDGDFVLDGSPTQLMEGGFLAGPSTRYPASGTIGGLSAAWLGTPTFDAQDEMARAARGYAFMARHFPHLKPTPQYRIFVQFRDHPPYSNATAIEHSFILASAPVHPGEMDKLRVMLLHEMIHQWVGVINEPFGVASWFQEGLTTYYEEVIGWKGGFITTAEYQNQLDQLSKDYMTNKARNWSAASIAQVGFDDEGARHLAYRRGALYFYDLDARIRAKSGGKRNLESLLFPLFLAREQGRPIDNQSWIAAVSRELGPEEKQRFERLIVEGSATLIPRTDALGPCFKRTPAVLEGTGGRVQGFRWTRSPGTPERPCKAF